MNSSRPKHGTPHSATPIEKRPSVFSDETGFSTADARKGELPGTLNDAALVRWVVGESLRTCGLSRENIADHMSLLTGTSVTASMLNNFAAESRGDVRFPCELERAFCIATGDSRLLTCRAELAGLHLVDGSDLDLMELGRQYLIEKRAGTKRQGLEDKLAGVDL